MQADATVAIKPIFAVREQSIMYLSLRDPVRHHLFRRTSVPEFWSDFL